jgi:hypothetical protein
MKKRLKNENEKQKRKKKKERKLGLATNAWRIDEMIIMMNMKMIHYLMKNAIVMERGIGREGKREERK